MKIEHLRPVTRQGYENAFKSLVGAMPASDSMSLLVGGVAQTAIPLRTFFERKGLMAEHLSTLADAGFLKAGICAHLISLAQAYMGSEDKAVAWLAKPQSQFDGLCVLEQGLKADGFDSAEQLILQMGEGLCL